MTPEAYVRIRIHQDGIINVAMALKYMAQKEARSCEPPKNLRPATPDDITKNNVIWSYGDDGLFWSVVEEVINTSNMYKAYVYDSCRYGLDGAFVEVKNA